MKAFSQAHNHFTVSHSLSFCVYRSYITSVSLDGVVTVFEFSKKKFCQKFSEVVLHYFSKNPQGGTLYSIQGFFTNQLFRGFYSR